MIISKNLCFCILIYVLTKILCNYYFSSNNAIIHGNTSNLRNISHSGKYFTGCSGTYKINYRIDWSLNNKPDALVICLHGYASHSSTPAMAEYTSILLQHNIAVASMYFIGHGYSQGRCGYIPFYEYLQDDGLLFILEVFSKTGLVPFFIQGFSMGGAVAILISNILSSKKNSKSIVWQFNTSEFTTIIRYYRGLILLAPLTRLVVPPIINWLIDVLAVLFRYSKLDIS